jgi:hypothetical protein
VAAALPHRRWDQVDELRPFARVFGRAAEHRVEDGDTAVVVVAEHRDERTSIGRGERG